MSRCPVSIAIVLPAWQVARWLPETLAALEGQTFRGWVCHAVDDGSCDGTGELLDAAVRRDGRYWVVHQRNAGVSVARNRALAAIGAARDKAFSREGRQGPADDSVTCVTESRRLRGAHHDEPAGEFTTSETSSLRTQGEFTRKACGARGERARYIAFLDGDDVPLPGWFEAFAEIAAESGAQIIRQGYLPWDGAEPRPSVPDGHPTWAWLKRPGEAWERRSAAGMDVFTHCMSLWLNVFDVCLLASLRCPEGVRVGEDMAAVFGALCRAESVAVGGERGFLYRQRADSVTHGGRFRGEPGEMVSVLTALAMACEETDGGAWFEWGFARLAAAALWPVLVVPGGGASRAERVALRRQLREFFATGLGRRMPPPRWHYWPACLLVRWFGILWPLRVTRLGGSLRCWVMCFCAGKRDV